MKERVLQVIRDHCCVKEGSRLILAVSGGPDSICLLNLLKQLPYQICVAHLNHQLRAEAEQEAEFVKKLTASLGLPFFLESIDVEKMAKTKKIGIEEAARDARYKFLFEIAEKANSQAVITAHHADDQIETVLMNLIRGAGLRGMAGMSYCQTTQFSHRIRLIRPLLDFWKDELLNYCTANHLDYFVDQSNLTNHYFRNKIRNHLLPILKGYNPNIKNAILRTSKTMAVDLDFIRASLEKEIDELLPLMKDGHISFSLKKYRSLPDSLKNYFLIDVFQRLRRDQAEVSFDLIDQTKCVLDESNRMVARNLGKEIFLLVEGDTVTFTKDPNHVWKDEWPVCLSERSLELSNRTIELGKDWQLEMKLSNIDECRDIYKNNQDRFTAYLDRSVIMGKLFIRNWSHGDGYQLLGMDGKKVKLTDFWIDRKIPSRARTTWPLIVANGEIAWIPGFQPSHLFRIRETTRKILVLRLQHKP